MQRALELARRGAGLVEPNPMVGAVVVREGKIVGEGWHRRFGGPHAEVMALRKAGSRARGATLYVNLEPCSPHPKKTPPCTELILKSGLARVVAACTDPNPLVQGRGLSLLRKGGVTVSTGLLGKEAREGNRAFFKWNKTGFPYILSKWAMTLDGKIATHTGDSKWISSVASRKWLHQLRDEYPAILIGANTALRDDPTLRGTKLRPVRIILDTYARVPIDAKVVKTAKEQRTILAVSASAPEEKLRLLRRAGVEVIQLEILDLRILLEELARSGITKILVEGGGEVHASIFEAGLSDEVCIFIAPKITGGADARTPVEGVGFGKIIDSIHLSDVTMERIEDDMVIRGKTGSQGGKAGIAPR
jgi:diaminohydroxyphosphoribosylaminopyrimidine deaminase/5-amino-6-(5-phosphoribosylamino)uracil reductase